MNNYNNNKKKIEGNNSMKNIKRKPHNLRVSSSISSYNGCLPANKSNNNIKEKIGTSYYKVTKSKSSENFLVYNTNKNYPKICLRKMFHHNQVYLVFFNR